ERRGRGRRIAGGRRPAPRRRDVVPPRRRHPRLGPNRSGGPRIGFAIRYTTPEVSQERPHHAVVLARRADRHRYFTVGAAPAGDSVAEGLLAQQALAKDRWPAQPPSSRREAK